MDRAVSPWQASVATILKVDLYGTALVLEMFGNVIDRGGSGVVIASQSGASAAALSVEQTKALATIARRGRARAAIPAAGQGTRLGRITGLIHA